MAEGFARRYGSDVLDPVSAGLAPAAIIQPLTKKVMAAKNISLDDVSPKHVLTVDLNDFDLIINISGQQFPLGAPVEIREWKIEDPIGRSEETYIAVRDQIEMLVMHLILELRRAASKEQGNLAGHPMPRRAKRSAEPLPVAEGETPK